MKYMGILEYKVNKDIRKFEIDIKTFLAQLVDNISESRRTQDESLTMVSLSAEDETIRIELGGGYGLHLIALMIKNKLRAFLGEKFVVGVRESTLCNYKIVFDIDQTYLCSIKERISSFKEVLNVSSFNGNVMVEFKDLDESKLKSNVVNRLIKIVAEETREELVFKISKVKPGTILSRCKQTREFKIAGDLTQLLEDRGWIKRFPGRGQWIYLPPYTCIFRVLWEQCIDVARKNGYNEALFPKLIHTDIMMRMAYFEGLPEGMYYVSHAKRNPELFHEFKQKLRLYGELPVELLKKGLNDPEFVLAPAQCEPFYQLFCGEILGKSSLPIKLFDASGFTYRYEGGGASGLNRVNEFQRVELVGIGTSKQIKKIADDATTAYEDLCDLLELEWFIEAGDDPFYLAGRQSEDRKIEFPDIPKREVRIRTPDGSISVGSINIHGTHFVEGFKIKTNFGEKLWTGCTGLGVSRLVYCFLIYHGLDFDKWPTFVRKKIGALPDVPATLSWPSTTSSG